MKPNPTPIDPAILAHDCRLAHRETEAAFKTFLRLKKQLTDLGYSVNFNTISRKLRIYRIQTEEL